MTNLTGSVPNQFGYREMLYWVIKRNGLTIEDLCNKSKVSYGDMIAYFLGCNEIDCDQMDRFSYALTRSAFMQMIRLMSETAWPRDSDEPSESES